MTEWTVSVRSDFTLKSPVLACGAAPVVTVEQWSTAGNAAWEPVTTLCTCHIPRRQWYTHEVT